MASDYPPQNGARRPASQARSYEDFFRDVVFKEENRRERARQDITARSDSPDFWRQLFDGPDKNRASNTGDAKILPDPPKDPNPTPGSLTGPQMPYPPKRPSNPESGGSIINMIARHQPNPPKPEPMPAPSGKPRSSPLP